MIAATEFLTITDDVFFKTYKPIQNHIDTNASWNGCLFELFGNERAHVLSVYEESPLKVWTVLDVNGDTVISNGFQRINSIGYLLTEVPAPDNTFIEVLDEDC